MKILLVGAGQIGSRHLQALAKLQHAEIVVVDPNPQSRTTAEERFVQVAGPGSVTDSRIRFLPETPLGVKFDVAIVATDARSRRKVVEQLVGMGASKRFVLEKVLFTRQEDYAAVANLLEKNQSKAWVNCPMRMWPGYRELRASLSMPVRMTVTGSNWGLACNAVHYLDLFAFLTGSPIEKLSGTELDAGVVASKRPGYSELTGSWVGVNNTGSITLTSWRTGASPVQVAVESEKVRFQVREDLSRVLISSEAGGWKPIDTEFKIPFQSQITDLVVTAIVQNDACELPDLATSIRVHEPVISGMLAHLKASNQEVTECPIT